MDEITRCCRLLGVNPGDTLDDVKKSYHELVKVWHPFRHSSDEAQQAKAAQQLGEINQAYQYLLTRVFQDSYRIEPVEPVEPVGPVTPAPPTDTDTDTAAATATPADHSTPAAVTELAPEPAPAEPTPVPADLPPAIAERPAPAGIGSLGWLLGGLVLILALASLLWNRHRQPQSPPAPASVATTATVTAPNTATTSPPGSVYPFTQDLLPTLAHLQVTHTDTARYGSDWLQSPRLLSPPFALHARVKLTNPLDLRLYYGLAQTIFNWENNPAELHVGNPRTSDNTSIPGQGALTTNEWHDLLWQITASGMTVSVDTQVLYQDAKDYSGIKGFAGIGPNPGGDYTLGQFSLQTPQPPAPPAPPVRDHGPIPHDLLATMAPEKNLSVTPGPDGLALWSADGNVGSRLMTHESFQPPFAIWTRAKIDRFNLRLFYGDSGRVILNWECDPHSLRIHDPHNDHQLPAAGSGLVSPNEWHTIVWQVAPDGMRVLVDGEPRYQNSADYHDLNAPVGISPAMGGITVDYFFVQKW